MWKICCASLALLFCVAAQAEAHFGMVIPSTATVTEKKDADLKLDISFSHPMEMQGMDMAAPKAFTVTLDGKSEDLKASLKPATVMGIRPGRPPIRSRSPAVYQLPWNQSPISSPPKIPTSSTIPKPPWRLSAARKVG